MRGTRIRRLSRRVVRGVVVVLGRLVCCRVVRILRVGVIGGAVMDSSNAEKAWEAAAQTPEFVGAEHGGLAYRVFMAGRASRDAEVAELTAAGESDRVKGAQSVLNEQLRTAEALGALAESRARFGDSEARRAELEAVRESVRGIISDSVKGIDDATAVNRIAQVLVRPRSVVLEDREREVAARTLEATADRWVADDCNLYAADRLRQRAATIRKGDTT